MQRAEMTEAIANEAGRRFHFVHSVALNDATKRKPPKRGGPGGPDLVSLSC